jgi:type II secretory pathway component HofQ
MPRRRHFCTALPLALLGFVPLVSQAQSRGRITVEYQNAALTQVVQDFSRFSGRTIVLSPDAGNPSVTMLVKDVEWERGLDGLLATRALVARPDSSGILRIERERRVVVEYDNARLSKILKDFSRFSGRPIILEPNVGDPEISAALRNVDWQRALYRILDQCGFVAQPDTAGALHVEPRPPR